MRLKVGSFNAHDQRVAMATAANECALLLGSETVQFAAAGWKWRAGGKGVQIGWRESVFTAESSRWHKAHDGKRFSLTAGTPTRGTLEVRGHLADGTKVCILDGHRINGTGWEGNRKRAGWQERRRMWAAHDALDRTLIAAALADGYTVLLGSDVNRRDMPKPHPDAVPLRASGITQLWLIPAPGVTHTLHKHGALETGARGTTHRLQWADLTLAGKATPPKETDVTRVTLGKDSSGRPLVVDQTTLDKLREAERRLGHKFVVVQGSWRGGSGAAASAGTHDKGGVIDLRTWDLGNIEPQRAVRVLRECGLIAWYRTKAQGFDPHIHAIDYGNSNLDPSAQRQVVAWQNGRNGLASNGPDDGARVDVPKVAPKAPRPTPNVTAFRLAPTRGLRRKAAENLAKRGGASARKAARAWIAADNAHTKALADKKAAYRAVVKNEVKES